MAKSQNFQNHHICTQTSRNLKIWMFLSFPEFPLRYETPFVKNELFLGKFQFRPFFWLSFLIKRPPSTKKLSTDFQNFTFYIEIHPNFHENHPQTLCDIFLNTIEYFGTVAEFGTSLLLTVGH